MDEQAEAAPSLRMIRAEVRISSTGRPAAVELPADATDGEFAEFAGWLLTQVLTSVRDQRHGGIRSRLVIP